MNSSLILAVTLTTCAIAAEVPKYAPSHLKAKEVYDDCKWISEEEFKKLDD